MIYLNKKRPFPKLKYEALEKLEISGPVDRLSFISGLCKDKTVLDIGCLDETALFKKETRHWLHGRIASVAKRVIGVDNSDKIPVEGIRTADNSIIYRGDSEHLMLPQLEELRVDIVIAGELIEHLENPLLFLRLVRERYPNREFVFSTPNGISIANTLLALIKRESQHKDHLHIFTLKILATLCRQAGFEEFEIVPYRFYATEMIFKSKGLLLVSAIIVQGCIRLLEKMFPLLSFGYVVRIRM
ncbi:class I SAM-dependent methyltransferase [Holophaga foetida]|uniref:class I SAM-dependent methyltransferase n=1 Tax=Holophaga foetida TaxID=35839 RepID=UPI0002474CCE|nr:methyltransferase domain-containing protein [Holophaga foetida]